MAEEHFRAETQRRHDNMLYRRALVRQFIEENYGVQRTRLDLMEWLEERGHSTTYSTLTRDFMALNVQEVSAVIEGKRTKFWVIPGFVSELSPERLHDRVDPEVIEAEAFRAIIRTVLDIFSDGKRVILATTFEGAKPLALWLKNLNWPEIWYFAKEDGSSVIIECRTPAHAEVLKKRLWGDVSEDSDD